MAKSQRKSHKKSPNLVLQSLEFAGKPLFFLFAIILTGIYTLALLGLRILRSIKVSQITLPSLPTLPRPTFPHVKLPKFSLPRLRPALPAGRYSIFIFYAITLILLSFTFYWYILRDLPSARLLTSTQPSLTTKMYDRNGVLLYQIYKDQNRTLIHLSDLPPYVVSATLAAEDKNFYHHFGFDLTGITRASLSNISCRLHIGTCTSSLQGGSTITQQLVKNVLLTPERSFSRKVKELILAIETEYLYSKDQILEMYLNQVGYGGTAYGIEEASEQYFDKPARDLTLAESAMLAGLPISPTVLSPFGTNPYLGKIRQQQVLESMVANKMITENDKVKALETTLVFHPQGTGILAPHFVMYVKDLLVKKYGEDMVSRGGLEVTTTLDLSDQNLLQNEVNTELAKLQKLHVENGAGLIIAPKTGNILAMVGSLNFFDSEHDGQVNIPLQARQPGSSIKPITYSLALMRGATPSSVIDDAPVCYMLKGQPDYCPKNYDGRFHGPVTLRTALASSYNIPATKLLNVYGISNMVNLARLMGITTWNDPSRFGLSLTLGSGEVTMMDLATVYSVFANSGEKIPFNAILSVRDAKGKLLPLDVPERTQVIPASIAYQISSMLSDAAARAPAFGTHSVLNLPGPNVAVKTGTTNDLRDNWTFGYTPDLLVATWVGNNDNTPMSSVASGITGASPIWARTMQELLKNTPATPFIAPADMIKVNLSCTNVPKYDYFVPGNVPKIDCTATPSGTLLNAAAATVR